MQKEVIRDIRRQLVWINDAIESNDLDYLNELAYQLSATALNLSTESLVEKSRERRSA